MGQRPDKITLSIPPDLKRKARVKALLEGRSLSAIVTEMLEKWLREDLPTKEEKIQKEE
jgi:hypothetical protein